MAADGSPFVCETCEDKDRRARNCQNLLGLSDEAKAVTAYSPEIISEHEEKNATKVFSLGSIRLYECPLSYLTRDTSEIMRMIYLFDGTKNLPYGGGWADQPMWFVEAYEIFRREQFGRLGEKG